MHLPQAAEDVAGHVLDVGVGRVEADVLHPPQEGGEAQPALEAGKGGARAEVGAVADDAGQECLGLDALAHELGMSKKTLYAHFRSKDTIVAAIIDRTGALIRASVRSGALYAKANKRQFTALTRYGEMTGLAFQIADDILDITGKQEEIGKDVGSDLKKGKRTFPSFYGLE